MSETTISWLVDKVNELSDYRKELCNRIAAKDAEIAELRQDLYFTKANLAQRDVAFAQQRADWAKAVTERDEARECVRRLCRALEEIAAFKDVEASARLVNTGSYSRFDEPNAVRSAREALAATPEHLR